MQQLVDLGHVRNIGCGDHHAVYQARFLVGVIVYLRAEVALLALLGLVHFRVALLWMVRRTLLQEMRG